MSTHHLWVLLAVGVAICGLFLAVAFLELADKPAADQASRDRNGGDDRTGSDDQFGAWTPIRVPEAMPVRAPSLIGTAPIAGIPVPTDTARERMP